MLNKAFISIVIFCFAFQANIWGQTIVEETPPVSTNPKDSVIMSPTINYTATPKKYTIEHISVSGLEGTMYEEQDFVMVNFSGLSVGQEILIPGEEITYAVERFWKQGLFADIKILVEKIEGDKVWLEIRLTGRPRITDIHYTGMKRGERNDIEEKIGMVKGNQVSPNQVDRAKTIIEAYFAEKGFGEAEVTIMEKPDPAGKNQIILDIEVDKKEKIKVNSLNFYGNEALKDSKLAWTMKKTNEKGKLINLFRTKKFVEENYEADKKSILDKYHELGYRDAEIVSDSVYSHDDKTVNIDIKIDEGVKYYIRKIQWVGNTQYNSLQLDRELNMKAGDVYNQKKLQERLITDEDAAINIYQNNGYLFSNIDPIEVNIVGDSVDLELRVIEGSKATIRRVAIRGNDRLYEDVVRRELRTKPGAVFSKEQLIRSIREIAQTGHFDPENMQPDVVPDPESGTVDITYGLVSKGNDQIEFSAGWGITGLVGKLSLKLTNFSLKNMLNPSSYRGIIPQGEGQTLILSAQTNGQYYQSYQFSFIEPWFGGKRPNSLSVSAFYSRQSDISDRAYQDPYGGMYGGGMYGGGMYGGGMYGGGYPGYGGQYQQNMIEASYDPDKTFEVFGASLGYSKRLAWPDDYFYLQGQLGYQMYRMKNWRYFLIPNGVSNSLTIDLTLARNSIDNPLYTRLGSQFTFNVSLTPPFSLWDGVDYKNLPKDEQGYENPDKYKWLEYHKWKFKMRTYTPLSSMAIKRTPVLATRAEFGFLGYYNKDKKSVFETFDVGGDGMSGYSSQYATETIALRGYENGSIGRNASAYTRLGLEFRYPFILEPSSTIYGVAFIEAGNAWQNVGDFNPFDLKRSAGVGARIHLPMIGLMGIDWAYGFDKVGGSRNSSGSQFHFIIGQEF
jgi:outer membrane protein insertion porin family